MELIRLENVKKIYQTGEVITKAVDGIDFTVNQGEFALIIGASGAGKTTVLNILGGMDTATSGAVYIDGEDISKWNKKQLTGYRRDDIGFVFQFYNLVPNLISLRSYLVGNSREFLLHVHWQRIQRSCSVMSQLVPWIIRQENLF